MPSAYLGFSVTKEVTPGITVQAAAEDVFIRVEGEVADEAESPLTTNADGDILAGTLADVDPGTLVHFYFNPAAGVWGTMSQITQEI